jgi:hypothetical protein
MTDPLCNAIRREHNRKFLLLVGVLAVWGGGLAMSRAAMTLVFVDVNGKETTLVSGANKLPSLNGNIRADGVPALTQSVLFKVNGERRLENVPKYYAFGDVGNVPKLHQFQPRAYVVSAAAYRYDNAKGSVLGGTSVSFTLELGTPNPPPPPPDPNPDPDPPPVTSSLPYRYFALQPGGHAPPEDLSEPKGGRLISEAQLRLPLIDGLTIRFRHFWDWEPFVAANVAKCERTGDKFTLLPMGGITATPWDPSNISRYESIYVKLGAKYRAHPRLAGVHVCGASNPGTSEELHWKPSDNRAYIGANKKLIDIVNREFPNAIKILAVGGGDPAGMNELIDYGLLKCPGKFLVKHNSLKQSTTLTATHNVLVANAGKRGAKVGFEMVSDSSEGRFGPGGIMAGVNMGRTLLKNAGLNPDNAYYAIYPGDLGGLR